MKSSLSSVILCLATLGTASVAETPTTEKTSPAISSGGQELLFLDNGTVRVGLDRAKGASITWLSWKDYQRNSVNVADPGRLIQQSYYAGHSLDRTADGQHTAWSPWTWNPIQGGGVGSWARVLLLEQKDDRTLFGETIPKLWDMPNEEAKALMKQWTRFEPDMPNVLSIQCAIICQREDGDRWGPATERAQELPACYFTRNFSTFKSYLGHGQWRDERQAPGPPWGKADPPRKALACFDATGQGVAVFSPSATHPWNFGPHADGDTNDPKAGPCVHIAPLSHTNLGPKSTYQYRYWLTVGTEESLSQQLEALWRLYATESATIETKSPS